MNPDPLTAFGVCARDFGSDGMLCSTHDGWFATPSETRCDLYPLAAFRGAAARADTAPGDEGRLRELLREAIETAHQTGSIRDHADPNDKTGWNVHGIETCQDPLCVDALAALAEPSRDAGLDVESQFTDGGRIDREFRLLQAAQQAVADAGTNDWPANLDRLRAAISEYEG